MSEVKHTPGPWALDDTGWIARVDNGEPVCLINAGLRNDELPSQELADAHLIAAAPELLEALRRCASALLTVVGDETVKQTTVLNAWAQCVEAEAVARAAIARAEGRQP